MKSLPTDLVEYISDFSSILYLVNVNKSYNKRYSDRCKMLKQKNIMSKKVIDTFLIEMKKRKFEKSVYKKFDFYLFHHVTNVQEINSLHKWWLKKYPLLNTKIFVNYIIHIIHILGNRDKDTKKVLREYLEEIDKVIIYQ